MISNQTEHTCKLFELDQEIQIHYLLIKHVNTHNICTCICVPFFKANPKVSDCSSTPNIFATVCNSSLQAALGLIRA